MTHVQTLLSRLLKKLAGLVPILVGAGILTVVLMLLLYAVRPFLPDGVQEFLRQVQDGDWEAGRASLERWFDGYGAARPYVFFALQVLQVLFAPIPGQLLGFLGGYLFGFWQGLSLAMAGLALGSLLAVGIGRLLGERLVRRVVPPAVLARFDYLITEGGLWSFFVLFLLPALPDDAICFIAGLSRLRVGHLVLVCILGRLPGTAALIFVGASVGGGTAAVNVVIAVATLAALALWLFSDEVEAYCRRLADAWARRR